MMKILFSLALTLISFNAFAQCGNRPICANGEHKTYDRLCNPTYDRNPIYFKSKGEAVCKCYGYSGFIKDSIVDSQDKDRLGKEGRYLAYNAAWVKEPSGAPKHIFESSQETVIDSIDCAK